MRKGLLIGLAVALPLGGALVAGHAHLRGRPEPRHRGVLAADSYDVDRTSESAVNHAYRTRWLPATRTGPAWTGSVRGCHKGTESTAYVAELARAVNLARALNHLDAVGAVADHYSSGSTYSTQAAALIMRANGRLSHDVTPDWTCYSRTGAAGAARSNLSLTFATTAYTAGQAVRAYVDDAGSDAAVGHRRWLLDPWTQRLYVGGTTSSNAAMPMLASTTSGRRNPAYTSWPSAGWFPSQLDPAGRWSWSTRDRHADLSGAKVRMWKGGVGLSVRQYRPVAGYGQPTLVWQLPAESRRVGVYRVTVSGVRSASGALRSPTTYWVHCFVSWAE